LKEEKTMLIFIGILYIAYHLIKESLDNAEMKEWSKRNGFDTYSSKTGLRDVKTDRLCYIDPRTGEKKLL
jgi:hypothetical protein